MSSTSYPNPRYQGFSEFGQGTPKRVTVGIVSTELLAANLDRLYAQINNNSGQVIWVSKGVSAMVGQGTRVSGKAMLTFTDNELYLGALNAITEGSPVAIDIEEGI